MNIEDVILSYQLNEKLKADRFKVAMQASIALVEMLSELHAYKNKSGETELYKKKLQNISIFQLLLNQNMELISLNDQMNLQQELFVSRMGKDQELIMNLKRENEKLLKTIEAL